MSILIQGGQVVSSSGATPADLIIDGETITAVLDPASDLARSAAEAGSRTLTQRAVMSCLVVSTCIPTSSCL